MHTSLSRKREWMKRQWKWTTRPRQQKRALPLSNSKSCYNRTHSNGTLFTVSADSSEHISPSLYPKRREWNRPRVQTTQTVIKDSQQYFVRGVPLSSDCVCLCLQVIFVKRRAKEGACSVQFVHVC
jgi:hypothetical protein